jgi:hypothetical protein
VLVAKTGGGRVGAEMGIKAIAGVELVKLQEAIYGIE